MIKTWSALVCLGSAIGLASAQASSLRPSVVYGDDNRQDIFEVTNNADVALASSTVALMESSALKLSAESNTYAITYKTLKDAMGVCADEPYANQPTAAFCSGSLVAPDIIMTAGHCVTSVSDCADTKFVFGYAVTQKDQFPSSAPSSEVYGCKSIIKREQNNTGSDYALIRLDRAVVGHAPLAINRTGNVAVDADVGVIGHPSGLPVKVAFGAKVRAVKNGYFVTNLDTYGGNSGSAVFNQATGEVEGVLVRGENDFVYKNGCYVTNRCAATGCRGEDVTLISALRDLIPQQ